jgi:MFS family permease
MYLSASVGIYSFLIFLPVILRAGLGFSLSLSFLLSAPPAAFSVVCALIVSWLADKYRVRGPFVFGEALLTIAGLSMIGFIEQPVPRYIGAFLGQAGSNALVITSLAWGQNNVRSDAKRSVTTAIQVMMASIGGIYSALVFRQQVSRHGLFPL